MTRRTALGAGAGGAAAMLLGGAPAMAADTVATFVLDPLGGRGDGCVGSSCASCAACANHAANKLFTSEQVATTNLAHPGCRCVVVPGPALLRSVYDQVFAGGLTVVDRRWSDVAAALAANGNQRSVPMFVGDGPLGVLVAGLGAAALWATLGNRRAAGAPGRVPVGGSPEDPT